MTQLSDDIKLTKQKKHNIEVVVDRLILREDIRTALEEGEPASAVAKRLSQKYSRRKRDVYAMVLDMQ